MMFAAIVLASATLANPGPIPNVPDEHQENVHRAVVRLSLANICERTDEEFKDVDGAAALLELALLQAGYPNAVDFAAEAAQRASAATPADARLGKSVCESLSRTIASELND